MITFLLLYAIIGFIFSSITVKEEANAKDEITIYIKSNGVHTDIVVPIKSEQYDWSQEIKFSHTKSQDSNMNFLALGWGDKGFYLHTPTWAELKFSTAFKAAFGLSSTAIHTTYYKQITESKTCKKVLISKAQYQRLLKYILGSFQKDKNGRLVHIKTNANYGKTDAFYEANGRYSLFKTCNTWANTALKKSGQRACLWTPMDKSILAKYE